MNCNTFSRFLIQYLDPSEKEDALNALREVIFQTAQTANNIGRILLIQLILYVLTYYTVKIVFRKNNTLIDQ